MATVGGSTNGFASYEVYVNGVEVFDRQQGSFWQLLGFGTIPLNTSLWIDDDGAVHMGSGSRCK
jgi:hypothetical protein